MSARLLSNFLIVLLVLTGSFHPAIAQWSTSPNVNNAISTAADAQESPRIVSDGAGGAIITWEDLRTVDYDIYAQRINAAGVVQWTADGVAISTAVNAQLAPTLVSDGAGGAIITYHANNPNFIIYAQRVNAAGVVQWTADGVVISTAANDRFCQQIESDGAGGAIITWEDRRSGTYDVYAQRIDSSGVVQWTADGIGICTAANDQLIPTIASDSAGGAIITWFDRRSGTNYDIYAQRINASGVAQWTGNGVAICMAADEQRYPTIVSDEAGGAIISWDDYRSGLDVYAQRINSAGAVQWTADGVAISTAGNGQVLPNIISDGAGGGIITWHDYRSGRGDIYAQRINSSGVVQWTSDGVAISTAVDNQLYPTITSDNAGGAIMTWYDFRDGISNDIYAQRINSAGAVQWTANGVAISTAANIQDYPVITTDDAGGATITWNDLRGGIRLDIYAQHVTPNGSLGASKIISGTKFNDHNGNGFKDPADSGLAGWKIILANFTNTVIDTAETDASGNYAFSDLADDSYTVREVQQAAWIQTHPSAPGTHTVDVAGAGIHRGNDFGNIFPIIAIVSGNYSNSSIWSGGVRPDSSRAAGIGRGAHVFVDSLPPGASVLALRIDSTGSLTFKENVGPLTLGGRLQIDEGSVIQFPSANATGFNCYGDWVNNGTFLAGNSTITFAGDSSKTIDASDFYNLEIAGLNTGTADNLSVTNALFLRKSLAQRQQDTIFVENNSPGAIVDTGRILRGTIKRRIGQGEMAPYRFESQDSYIQFDGTGTYATTVAITAVPDTTPSSFKLRWQDAGGVADNSANTVTASSITHFSKWALGIPRPTGPVPVINREYKIAATGGSDFRAQLRLRYDQSEVPPGTDESTLHLLRGAFVEDSVKRGWNMISLPVIPEDNQKDSLFPTSVSAASAYSAGYVTHEYLSAGTGYWLKFAASGQTSTLGDDLEHLMISVSGGWNMIGALSLPISTSSVLSDPPGIIVSKFFEYKTSYNPADSLKPSRGYWVKVQAPGVLILDSSPAAVEKTRASAAGEKERGILAFRDREGNEQSLYIAQGTEKSEGNWELPPRAPDGAFDVRFQSGKMLEVADKGKSRDLRILISSGSYPLRLQWNGQQIRQRAWILIDGKRFDMTESGEIIVVDAQSIIILRLSQSREDEIPSMFALAQNYPNPFNPSTLIRYQLPVESWVSLKIYNILGQVALSLVDGPEDAGFKQVECNATGVPSGIYFYRLVANAISAGQGSFTETKKLIIMK